MNYKNIYESIIKNRQQHTYSGYTESHHILPKSLGGNDDPSNLVSLSAREHFICHLLLTKIVECESSAYYKMVAAFLMMLQCKRSNQERYITNRTYERLRIAHSLNMSAKQAADGNNRFGYMWIHNTTLQLSKTVPKSTLLEPGWKKGRIVNWNRGSELNQRKIKEAQVREERKVKEQQERERLAIKYYDIYIANGFDEFVRLTGYKLKMWALLNSFRKFVPHYKPYAVQCN